MPGAAVEPTQARGAAPAAGPAVDPALPPADPAAATEPTVPPLSAANKAAINKSILVLDAALQAGDLHGALESLTAGLKAVGGELTLKDFPVIKIDAERAAKLTEAERTQLIAQVYDLAMSFAQSAYGRGEIGVMAQAIEAASIAATGGKGAPTLTPDALKNMTDDQLLEKARVILTNTDIRAAMQRNGLDPEIWGLAYEAVMNALPPEVGAEKALEMGRNFFDMYDKPREEAKIEPLTVDQAGALNRTFEIIRDAIVRGRWREAVAGQDFAEQLLTGDTQLKTTFDAATAFTSSFGIADAAMKQGRMDLALQALEMGYIAKYGGEPMFTPERIEQLLKKDPQAAGLEMLQIVTNISMEAQQTGDFGLALEMQNLLGVIQIKMAEGKNPPPFHVDTTAMAKEAQRVFNERRGTTFYP